MYKISRPRCPLWGSPHWEQRKPKQRKVASTYAQCNPPQRPFDTVEVSHASLLPMLPKHRQLQKSMLSIHTPDSTVSWLTSPPNASSRGGVSRLKVVELFRINDPDRFGIISVFTPSRRMDPISPKAADRMKPGLDRSMSHHIRGFTSASDADICRLDVHATLRYCFGVRR